MEHNIECEPGLEVTLQLVTLEGEDLVTKNLPSLEKSQLLSVIGGYTTSGVMSQLKDLQKSFEQEVGSRLHTLAPPEIVYILRMFTQADCASAEFYARLDKFIGIYLSSDGSLSGHGGFEPEHIFAVLKCFYDSGNARPKLFIKLQQAVLAAAPTLDINVVCALLRLYVEMEIEQASFYEGLAREVESRLGSLDEGGLLNALVSFKQAPTQRQLSVISDLESILIGNLQALKLETIA